MTSRKQKFIKKTKAVLDIKPDLKMMSEEQKIFLQLHVVEQKSYKEIIEIMAVPNSTLTIWYEQLKEEREKIAKVRILWNRKKIGGEFSVFYQWYLSQDKQCFYCGINEQEIAALIDTGRLETKRLATRGRRLELDRKKSELAYSDLDNLTLCCYWCNNAKSDTFSEEEFLLVGKVFKSIWQQRLRR